MPKTPDDTFMEYLVYIVKMTVGITVYEKLGKHE